MAYTTKVKQVIRLAFGDRIATWLHALRFRWLACDGHRQEAEMSLVPRFVQAGDVVVDIGASGANWTLALSRQVGFRGHVYAFEADPYYAKVTAKTISLLRLKNVTFFPFGLSDVQETTYLCIQTTDGETMSGTSHVVRDIGMEYVKKGRTVEVKLKRLDDIAMSYPDLLSTRLIKCDVEGFELMVFRGSLNILAKARPVVITEVGHARLHGYEDQELFHFFSELRYRCYMLRSMGGYLRVLSDASGLPEGYGGNVIMLPEELTSCVSE
jgi:FkbM family methyltransferase